MFVCRDIHFLLFRNIIFVTIILYLAHRHIGMDKKGEKLHFEWDLVLNFQGVMGDIKILEVAGGREAKYVITFSDSFTTTYFSEEARCLAMGSTINIDLQGVSSQLSQPRYFHTTLAPPSSAVTPV